MASAAELLESVNSAITALLTGAQSYSIAGRSVTKANLAELRAMRKELLQEVQESRHGGQMARLGRVDSPI